MHNSCMRQLPLFARSYSLLHRPRVATGLGHSAHPPSLTSHKPSPMPYIVLTWSSLEKAVVSLSCIRTLWNKQPFCMVLCLLCYTRHTIRYPCSRYTPIAVSFSHIVALDSFTIWGVHVFTVKEIHMYTCVHAYKYCSHSTCQRGGT